MLTPGRRHDGVCAGPLLERIRVPRLGRGRPRCRPDHVVADKAYASRGFRAHPRKRRISHTIAEKRGRQRHRRAQRPNPKRPRPRALRAGWKRPVMTAVGAMFHRPRCGAWWRSCRGSRQRSRRRGPAVRGAAGGWESRGRLQQGSCLVRSSSPVIENRTATGRTCVRPRPCSRSRTFPAPGKYRTGAVATRGRVVGTPNPRHPQRRAPPTDPDCPHWI
ncbi:transposase [Streptomyces sp. NPDC088812]|uniref:transposase n=1 Tax=Streptomyces sp. NPDC088812 TaxID=3365905 RepID=UPI00380F39FB